MVVKKWLLVVLPERPFGLGSETCSLQYPILWEVDTLQNKKSKEKLLRCSHQAAL